MYKATPPNKHSGMDQEKDEIAQTPVSRIYERRLQADVPGQGKENKT